MDVVLDRPVGGELQLSDFYQLNGWSGGRGALGGHRTRLLKADSSPCPLPPPPSSLPPSSVVRGATRAPFNASYLPVMSHRLRRFTFRSFTFCTVLSPPRLPQNPRPPPPTRPPIIPSAKRSLHHHHPPKPHGNVLRNYSEVNRAGCRNEITAAGLSAQARGAIRQQEMTHRLHHPLPRQPATATTADLHTHAVSRIPPRPPCGKVMQLCSSKGRSPSVSPPPLVSGGR